MLPAFHALQDLKSAVGTDAELVDPLELVQDAQPLADLLQGAPRRAGRRFQPEDRRRERSSRSGLNGVRQRPPHPTTP
jgi:hypothetical protein